ncbi:unnamed protein product [Periconia digitata]|uniref:Uncharacterized protein n=1 Tax=Periconia digitata TaxID=1303443 RepID=A0A9W4UAG1_9PLEO|nr:unnamed protein product [Periconia digitata]
MLHTRPTLPSAPASPIQQNRPVNEPSPHNLQTTHATHAAVPSTNKQRAHDPKPHSSQPIKHSVPRLNHTTPLTHSFHRNVAFVPLLHPPQPEIVVSHPKFSVAILSPSEAEPSLQTDLAVFFSAGDACMCSTTELVACCRADG